MKIRRGYATYIDVQYGPLRTSPFVFHRAYDKENGVRTTALLSAIYPPRTRHVRSTMSNYVSLAFSDLDLLSTAVDHSEDDPTASRTRG